MKYPWFPGINLTFEVIEGLKKHQKRFDSPLPEGEPYSHPSLEAQIANIADEITYYSHDIDDGLESYLIIPRQLQNLEVWQQNYRTVRSACPKMRGTELTRYVIRCLIDSQVEDVVNTSSELIARSRVRTAEDVRRHPKALIRYSQPLAKGNRELRKFLYKNLYYHPKVAGTNRNACEALRRVFQAFIKNPFLMPEGVRARIKKEGLHRTVCDYISGMTDRFLLNEFNRVFDQIPKVPFGRLTRLSE